MEWSKENENNVAGAPFSIYHKWDAVKRTTEYTACVPVNEIPASLPAGMTSGSVPATAMNTIGHVGPYMHIGNAWSTQYSMKQSKKIKVNKNIDPIEVYMNSPMEVGPNELHTVIHMPIK